jgi:hypothetical protein
MSGDLERQEVQPADADRDSYIWLVMLQHAESEDIDHPVQAVLTEAEASAWAKANALLGELWIDVPASGELAELLCAAKSAQRGPLEPAKLEHIRWLISVAIPGHCLNVEGAELLADRDFQAQRADRAERERDVLISEAQQLREMLEHHQSAAANLRMTVSADRGGIPCWSPGGADCPPEGWHYIFGGPYTSYTLPEPDDDGQLLWWKYDEDEGCWREAESLPVHIVGEEKLIDIEEVRDEAVARAERAEAEVLRLEARVEVRAQAGLSRPEPPPVPNDSPAIWSLVIEDLRADFVDVEDIVLDALDRDAFGRAKYGMPVLAGNGRNALVDAYQEALDLAVYLRQAIEEGRDLRVQYNAALRLLVDLRRAFATANEASLR